MLVAFAFVIHVGIEFNNQNLLDVKRHKWPRIVVILLEYLPPLLVCPLIQACLMWCDIHYSFQMRLL